MSVLGDRKVEVKSKIDLHPSSPRLGLTSLTRHFYVPLLPAPHCFVSSTTMTLATPSSQPVQSNSATANFTSDPAYKRARRQFLKSTRNRPKDIEDQWTPFRAAEKKYKAKFPPPDLSGVLDLALLDEKMEDEIRKGHWKGGLEGTNVGYREVSFAGAGSGRKAYILSRIPGG